MEKGIMFVALFVALAASAAAATIKIRNLSVEQMREIKAKREFNEKKAAVLEAAKEELAARDRPKEEKPIELYPYQKKMMARMIKYFREREEEEKKLRKWNHYATHAKKWRTRKKYKKRIREYFSKRQPRGGNWPYGSGARIFRGIEYPWPSAGSDYYYGRHPGGGIWNTPGLRRSPWIPFNGPAAPIFKPEGGKNYD